MMKVFSTEKFPLPGVWPTIKEEPDDIEETFPDEVSAPNNLDSTPVDDIEQRMIMDRHGEMHNNTLIVSTIDGE